MPDSATARQSFSVVDRATARWNALLERGDAAGQTRDALLEGIRKHGLLYGDRPIGTFLRPRFMDAETWRQAWRVGAWFHSSLARLMRSVARDGQALDDLGIHGRLQEIVRSSAARDDLLFFCRVDGFMEGAVIRLVEFNADSPGGAAFVDGLASLYEALPIFREFIRDFPLWRRHSVPSIRHAVAYAAKRAGLSKPRAAIVDWKDVATAREFTLIQRNLEENGIPTIVCDPREMELRGDLLTVSGQPVNVILKRVLVTELADRFEEARALNEALRRGVVVSLNPLACQAITTKSLLALFWEGRFDRLLCHRARRMWERHVPLTLRVRDGHLERDGERLDLLPWMERNQQRLVLKPSDAWGAEGVRLGWKTPPAEWKAALDEALRRGDHVVQERIEIPLEEFPDADDGQLRYRAMRTEISPYTFHPRTVCECLARLSSNDLMNVKTGGGVAPSYVVTQA